MKKAIDHSSGQAVRLTETGYSIPRNTTGTVLAQDFERGDHDTFVAWNRSCGSLEQQQTWVCSPDLTKKA